MRTFEQYLREAVDFRLGGKENKGVQHYNYFPKDKGELIELIKKLCMKRTVYGDFNDIDTSEITNMSNLFTLSNAYGFDGDISFWDTSNVTTMFCMFKHQSRFNQDISLWDTSNVTNMYNMFYRARSFNQDISNWNVSKVTNIYNIFNGCPIREEFKPKFNI